MIYFLRLIYSRFSGPFWPNGPMGLTFQAQAGLGRYYVPDLDQNGPLGLDGPAQKPAQAGPKWAGPWPNPPLGNTYHAFSWIFDPPESVTTYQEYLIYDEVSMIGSIGGTLGMCIGFSLTNLSNSFLNFIQYLLSRLES